MPENKVCIQPALSQVAIYPLTEFKGEAKSGDRKLSKNPATSDSDPKSTYNTVCLRAD